MIAPNNSLPYWFTAPLRATVEVPPIQSFADRVTLALTILRGHSFLITGQRMDVTITASGQDDPTPTPEGGG